MAGQGADRREVLRAMAMAAAASAFPGFSRWVFAHDHAHPLQPPGAPAKKYEPVFFNANEYATIERLTELIIPTDDTPGAREAGVSEFVDFMASADPKIQYPFRYGVTWLDAHALQTGGKVFRDLPAARQTSILLHLSGRADGVAPAPEGLAFFKLIREYTVMGFYTSRVGMEALGFPGLQFYSESPGCPHHDDPEHKHLA